MLAKIVEAGTALVCKQATPETGITAADWLQMWAVCCSKWLQRRGSVIADARAASGYLQCKSCTPRPRPVFAAAPVDFIHLQRNRPSSTAQLPKLHPRLWSHHSGAMFWCRAVKHKACCTRSPPSPLYSSRPRTSNALQKTLLLTFLKIPRKKYHHYARQDKFYHRTASVTSHIQKNASCSKVEWTLDSAPLHYRWGS